MAAVNYGSAREIVPVDRTRKPPRRATDLPKVEISALPIVARRMPRRANEGARCCHQKEVFGDSLTNKREFPEKHHR